jgi:hypothetical protein
MTVIKDGSGSSFLAGVTGDNRLQTEAIAVTDYAHSSQENGNAFQSFGTTTITAATEKNVFVLINNSSSPIAIKRFVISIQGETGKPVTIKGYIGSKTYTSGGTTKTPVNLNPSSLEISNVTFVSDNPTLGGSDNQTIELYLESTGVTIGDQDGMIILGKDNSTRITCTGAAGAAGTNNCSITATWYLPILLE